MSRILDFKIRTGKTLRHVREFTKPRCEEGAPNPFQPRSHPAISIPPPTADVQPLLESEQQESSDGELSECDDAYDSDTDGSGGEDAGRSSSGGQWSSMDSIREELFASQSRALQHVEGVLTAGIVSEKSVFEQQLAACCCPGCQAGACNPVPDSAVTVLVATCNAAHFMQIPRLYCSSCKTAFYPRPTVLGCLPGNRNAWDFKRTFDVVPVWFHLSLLSMLDSLQYHAKADRIYSLTQALEQHWSLMGSGIEPAAEQPGMPSSDTLRCQLSIALQEYQIIDTRLTTQVEQLAGWPASANRPCSACNFGNLHTAHFDVCSKY